MLALTSKDIDFKIAQPETFSIIGSSSIQSSSDFYSIDMNSISKEKNVRNKRLFDILSSFILLIFSPFILIFTKNSFRFINNSLHVLFGFKSWVGYYIGLNIETGNLPRIKTGILSPLDYVKNKDHSITYLNSLNVLYAKNYSILNDFNILIKGFNQIDRK